MAHINDGKPKKIVTLSLDDSVTQDERFIEILTKYDMPCTFNLNSGQFGMKDMIGPPEKRVPHDGMPVEKVKYLYQGYEVAAHTLHHPPLDTLSREEVIHEIEGDRVQIEEITGQKVYGLGLPGMNRFNDMVLDVVRNDTPLIYARTAEFSNGFGMPTADGLYRWAPSCFILDDEHCPELTDIFEAAEPKEDMLFFLVGHTYEFDIMENWDWIDSYIGRLRNMKDVIPATSAEVALYIRSKENV